MKLMRNSKRYPVTNCMENQEKDFTVWFVRSLGKELLLRALGEDGFVQDVVVLRLKNGYRKTKGSINDEIT